MMIRNKKVQIIFCVLSLFGRNALAQQNTQFSQWNWHQFPLNPAHAGIKSYMEIHCLYRLQWVGFDGAPRSGLIGLSAPLSAKRKKYLSARHGLGFRMESDRIGQFNTTRFNLAYAGHFNFSKDTRLSLGLYGGLMQFGYDPSGSTTNSPDPSIMKESSAILPDASFGAWWNGENYYFGLVCDNLLASRWDDLGSASRQRFHTSLTASYRMQINSALTFLPAAMVKIPPKGKVSADILGVLNYRNFIDFGLGFRTGDALIAQLGIKVTGRFALYYSYDAGISAFRSNHSGSHEISIVFNNGIQANGPGTKCPMF
jgi:type IX secretion system PorP/SprF family membrane protein